MELNGQSLEFVEKNYLGDTTGAVGGTVDSVIARSKFRDLGSLLTSRCLLLGAKYRLYSACICSVMLYGNQTWPAKEEDVIKLERNDPRMATWMRNVRHEEMIFAEELRTRLNLKSMRKYSQRRRLQWFGHLERMKEIAWPSKCSTFKVSGSFLGGLPRKT